MFLRELITEAPLSITIDEGVPAWLISMVRIDTSSSQWRKTKKGAIQTKELKCVQLALTRLGYNPGKADGWFGKKTARAVMEFQKDNDLTVDGDPGRNTIAKMIDIGKSKFPAAQDLTKNNVDDRFPLENYPLDNCAEIIVPEPKAGAKKTDPIDPSTGDKTEFVNKTDYYAWKKAGEPSEWTKGQGLVQKNKPSSRLDTKGETPFNTDVLKGMSVEEVKKILIDKIKQKRFKDALAILDYDMRLDIPSNSYQMIKQKANESLEEKQVWARSGMKVVRKYRCTSGNRRGRVVAQPAQCFKAKDIKKRMKMKQTKARLGSRMARKAKRTKRTNPASRRVQAMNR